MTPARRELFLTAWKGRIKKEVGHQSRLLELREACEGKSTVADTLLDHSKWRVQQAISMMAMLGEHYSLSDVRPGETTDAERQAMAAIIGPGRMSESQCSDTERACHCCGVDREDVHPCDILSEFADEYPLTCKDCDGSADGEPDTAMARRVHKNPECHFGGKTE